MDLPERIVAAGYDSAAARYAGIDGGERWPRMRWLRNLLARLPERAAVLDIGCATGVPVAGEVARRHTVTGVDVSGEQIAAARRNVPGGRFICADATAVEFSPGSFDAVVSFYSFDHIPREQHGALLERIHGWLRPGGYLLISVEDADEPGRVTEWLGVDMFFSMFDADTTRRLVTDAGFDVLETAVETQPEQDAEVPYVWILARRTSEHPAERR